ncbi:MAG: acetate/propionate family kinase [Rhodomicrobium sp.]
MIAQLLTLNAGSSSLKFALFDAEGQDPVLRASGQIEGLSTSPHLILRSGVGFKLEDRPVPLDGADAHEWALQQVLVALRTHFPAMRVAAVGHRIVHGGPHYAAPLILTDAIIAELRELIPLAPLHEPHNLAGIAAAGRAFPEAVQVGCFDTAFHRSHPWVNDTFALPRRYYEMGVRRYGFHGLSYEYVSARLREIAPHTAAGCVVVAHLGAGASMCAIKNGQSVASTMGFSALDSLPMGTRCGQLDPAVVLYLLDHEGMTSKQIAEMLYKDSGLKGLSGLSGDMRELEAAGTPEAEQAIDYFVFRIRRELGGLAASLSGLDAMVFCGGIGENSARIRSRICEDLHWIGLDVDDARNGRNETIISTGTSGARIFVIKTDEEAMIARHTVDLLQK